MRRLAGGDVFAQTKVDEEDSGLPLKLQFAIGLNTAGSGDDSSETGSWNVTLLGESAKYTRRFGLCIGVCGRLGATAIECR